MPLASSTNNGAVSKGNTSAANTITVEITSSTVLTIKAGTFTDGDGTTYTLSADKTVTLTSSATSIVQTFAHLVKDGGGTVDVRFVKYYSKSADQGSNSDSIPGYTQHICTIAWTNVALNETDWNNCTIYYLTIT